MGSGSSRSIKIDARDAKPRSSPRVPRASSSSGRRQLSTLPQLELEVAAREARNRNYLIAFGTYWASYVLTAPVGQVKRMFGPPDSLVIPPWRMAKGAAEGFVLGLNGVRPQATGFARQAWSWGFTFMVFASLNHFQESQRLASYVALKDKTAFGELAGNINAGQLENTLSATLDGESADTIRTPGNKLQIGWL